MCCEHASTFVIWRVTIINYYNYYNKNKIWHNHLPIKEFKTMYTYKNIAISINLQKNHTYNITTINYISTQQSAARFCLNIFRMHTTCRFLYRWVLKATKKDFWYFVLSWSCKIWQNTQFKHAKNRGLLGVFTCCKLANLSWNVVTEKNRQHPNTTRHRLWVLSIQKFNKSLKIISEVLHANGTVQYSWTDPTHPATAS